MIAIVLAPDVPPWYGSCRQFRSANEAKAAFDRVYGHDDRGSLGVGVYRHQRQGFDAEPVLVSVIGLDREGVLKAEELLGGEEIELHAASWFDLLRRRLEVVATLHAAGKKPGRHRVKHSPEGDKL